MAKTAKYKKNEELIRLAKNGDTAAEEELLINNDRLCFHLAKKYINIDPNIEDLASIARIGLLKAYKSFNLDKNIKFATYASRVMINEILMYGRKTKKHQGNISLDSALAVDFDGNDLTLMEVIPAPEEDIKMEDYDELNYILDKFKENASERDIAIMHRCIMNNENQLEVANSLEISQSYVSRMVKRLTKKLQKIAEFKGEDNVNKKYDKADYYFVFNNYPNLTNKAIAKLMNVSYVTIGNYKKAFKSGALDNYKDKKVSTTLMDKLPPIDKEDVVVKELEKVDTLKTVEENFKAIQITKEIPWSPPKVEEVCEKDIEIAEKSINSKKEEISKKETIILNNNISITSSQEEVSQLIFGIYQLLANTPEDSKIKLDLNFEVIKKESN